MSALRSVENWRGIIKGLTPAQTADRIFGDLVGYRDRNINQSDDADTLANAMIAFCELRSKS